jgi:hypothetical protein
VPSPQPPCWAYLSKLLCNIILLSMHRNRTEYGLRDSTVLALCACSPEFVRVFGVGVCLAVRLLIPHKWHGRIYSDTGSDNDHFDFSFRLNFSTIHRQLMEDFVPNFFVPSIHPCFLLSCYVFSYFGAHGNVVG